jgi:MSHA pilin protein MshC
MKMNNSHKTQRGFSLLELIIMIVLLGILAVTIGSRFNGTRGFAEFAYQSKLVSSLRTMQTRGMQDTRRGFCFKLNFTTLPSAFGPPTTQYNTSDSSASCANTVDYGLANSLSTSATEMLEQNITISSVLDATTAITAIGFDNLGRPLTSANNCSSGCRIELSGEQVVAVCVEAQGFIHVCP